MILDSLYLLVSRTSLVGLRLVFLYGLASTLDRTEFGAVALAFAVAEFCRYVADWGGETYALRLFSIPDPAQARIHLRTALRWRFVAATAGSVFSFVAIRLLTRIDSMQIVALVALTSATSLVFSLSVNWFQARANLGVHARNIAVLAIFGCALQVYGANTGLSALLRLTILIAIEVAMSAYMFGNAISSARLRMGELVRGAFSHETQLLLRHCAPVAFATIASILYLRVDQFLIGEFSPQQTVGDYQLANRMIEPFVMVAATFGSTIYSRASALFHRSAVWEEIRALVVRSWGLMLVYGVGTAAVVGTASGFVISRYFVTYSMTHVFVWIALLVLIVRCMNLCIMAFIQGAGRYEVGLRFTFRNLMAITLACLVGLGFWGALGVAWGVAIGELVTLIQQGIYLRGWLATMSGRGAIAK